MESTPRTTRTTRSQANKKPTKPIVIDIPEEVFASGKAGQSGDEAVVKPSPGRRGRPRKTSQSADIDSQVPQAIEASPGRRGRSRKTLQSGDIDSQVPQAIEASPGRRGRSRKTSESGDIDSQVPQAIGASPGRRGRPRKASQSSDIDTQVSQVIEPSPGRQGRARKTSQSSDTEAQVTLVTRGGRTRTSSQSSDAAQRESMDVDEAAVTSVASVELAGGKSARSRRPLHSTEIVEVIERANKVDLPTIKEDSLLIQPLQPSDDHKPDTIGSTIDSPSRSARSKDARQPEAQSPHTKSSSIKSTDVATPTRRTRATSAEKITLNDSPRTRARSAKTRASSNPPTTSKSVGSTSDGATSPGRTPLKGPSSQSARKTADKNRRTRAASVDHVAAESSSFPEVESGRRRMRSAEPESSGVRVDVRVIEGARRAKSSSKSPTKVALRVTSPTKSRKTPKERKPTSSIRTRSSLKKPQLSPILSPSAESSQGPKTRARRKI